MTPSSGFASLTLCTRFVHVAYVLRFRSSVVGRRSSVVYHQLSTINYQPSIRLVDPRGTVVYNWWAAFLQTGNFRRKGRGLMESTSHPGNEAERDDISTDLSADS